MKRTDADRTAARELRRIARQLRRLARSAWIIRADVAADLCLARARELEEGQRTDVACPKCNNGIAYNGDHMNAHMCRACSGTGKRRRVRGAK